MEAPPPGEGLAGRGASPAASRQQATFATEQEGVADGVMPAAPHRPRVSRRVRAALAVAPTRAQPIGAITLLICHDHLTRAAAERAHDMECATEIAASHSAQGA
jgi:hypothetical protein